MPFSTYRKLAWFVVVTALSRHLSGAETALKDGAQLQIDRQLFFTTTRIEAFLVEGGRKSTGTGFIVRESYSENQQRLFLVTCAHVIHGMTGLNAAFVGCKSREEPDYSKSIVLTIDDLPTKAFLHPDPSVDVAIIPITLEIDKLEKKGTPPFLRSLTYNSSLSAANVQLSSLQNIVFIGYPRGIIDTKNLSPLARRGTTATPIDLDFNGFPFFVIDASVYNGSSGSPVFAYDDGTIRGKNNETGFGTRAIFLGIISQAYFYKQEGEIKFTSIPTAESKNATYTDSYGLNLGIVIKERVIFELIELFHRSKRLPMALREIESAEKK